MRRPRAGKAQAKLDAARPATNGLPNGTRPRVSVNGANGHTNGVNGHSNGTPGVDPRRPALALIPSGFFVLTAAYGESRGGVVVRWVQQVSATPPLIVVAIEKGQPLSPLIRDSRRFVVCQLADDERVLRKIFEMGRENSTDPFLGLTTFNAPGGAPVPVKASTWLDCELTRHLDVEGNCELYVGLVHAGAVLPPALGPKPL